MGPGEPRSNVRLLQPFRARRDLCWKQDTSALEMCPLLLAIVSLLWGPPLVFDEVLLKMPICASTKKPGPHTLESQRMVTELKEGPSPVWRVRVHRRPRSGRIS